MCDVFNKTRMYVRVTTGKENVSEDWSCFILMFLTSFKISILRLVPMFYMCMLQMTFQFF